MRITVVEWDTRDFSTQFGSIADTASDMVLLPELPFSPWLPDTDSVDPAAWQSAVGEHDLWLSRLSELNARVVVGTRPIVVGPHRFNEAFVWFDGQVHPWRTKTYLPDEPGFWEARWYQRGPTVFEPMSTPVGRLGVLICTELWFPEHWRGSGIDVLLVPRATPARTTSKWVAGGRTAAVISGALCVSSNHRGGYDHAVMGGCGYVTHPEEGEILALTDPEQPVATVDVDMRTVTAAAGTYPRYVDSRLLPG